MKAGTIFLIAVSLAASGYIAHEAEHHWQIGGWAGLEWFGGVVASAAYCGAIAGAVHRG